MRHRATFAPCRPAPRTTTQLSGGGPRPLTAIFRFAQGPHWHGDLGKIFENNPQISNKTRDLGKIFGNNPQMWAAIYSSVGREWGSLETDLPPLQLATWDAAFVGRKLADTVRGVDEIFMVCSAFCGISTCKPMKWITLMGIAAGLSIAMAERRTKFDSNQQKTGTCAGSMT